MTHPTPKATAKDSNWDKVGREAWIRSANRIMKCKHDSDIAAIQYHILMDQIDMFVRQRDEARTETPKASAEKTILHLCADTGSDSKSYKDAGYNVILVGKDIGVENYHPPKDVYGIIANPVCTEFSIATGRDKQGDYEKGLFLVKECQRIISECEPKFWVIENPATGRLKDFLGKPVMTYEPWEYGSPWTKKTALWGTFNKPFKRYEQWKDVPKINLPTYQGREKPSLAKLHKNHKRLIREFDCFDVDSDMEFRSLCSQKFAYAFFQSNQ